MCERKILSLHFLNDEHLLRAYYAPYAIPTLQQIISPNPPGALWGKNYHHLRFIHHKTESQLTKSTQVPQPGHGQRNAGRVGSDEVPCKSIDTHDVWPVPCINAQVPSSPYPLGHFPTSSPQPQLLTITSVILPQFTPHTHCASFPQQQNR